TRAAQLRMDRMAAQGTTTLEIKSGYGLATNAEIELLEAAKEAAASRPYEVVTTFLGAHTFPAEARGSGAARRHYVDVVCQEMIPRVAEQRLARFVDVFVDAHAFDREQASRVLRTADEHGLGVKVHADQLADDGAAALAAEFGAISADHLEHTPAAGLDALARAGTVAVLIPGASLFLKMGRYAASREMIRRGIPVALATDLNPGTCPCESMPLVMQLGCLLCGLTIDEAIVASTINAACAIGLADRVGSIEPGKRCDLLVLDAEDRRQLVYRLGSPGIHLVIAGGRVVT
ncbi:MAG: imidazolonepropionase, partial [Acidobacteriota bacterium]